ncbi:unnamed protein product [Pieris brassicae]|uniref:Retrotransposon gag domain-containing protein n=1 Tax=Pieris brassicae TaxID=7116 RepID=A0A9P0TWY1_PIEBR|nr:unnamed protein product [Pieris brassicae]
MTCPFRRAASQHQFANGSGSRNPGFRSRQSSVHLPGPEEDDGDNNTLTLKNLSEALKLLTAPSNECLHAAVTALTKNQAEHYDKYHCLRRLPDEVKTCRNYAYLQEIYDAVRATDSVCTKDFIAKLGEYLILTAFSHNCRLERAFKCLGTNLTEFLTTLDSVHDVLHDQDDVFKDETTETEAAFVCTSHAGNIELHLTTESEPVAYMLVGSLRAIARLLYDTHAEIRLMSYTNDPRRFREKLIPFLNNCGNAYDLASDSKRSVLLKYILSQLEGKAESACAIKEFESWEQLSEFLNTQFGEKKHYSALLSDLQNCNQNNDSVNEFALRVESCLSKLLTEVNLSQKKKKSELAGRIAAMQDLALHHFVIGLKPQLSTIVRCRDPETLNDAINFAISEEKIMEASRKRYNNPQSQGPLNKNNYSRPNYQFRDRYQNKPTLAYERTPNNVNLSSAQSLFCRYCKAKGHVIENCRKREFNNRRFQNTNQNPRTFQPRTNSSSNHVNFADQIPDEITDENNEEGIDTVDHLN